MRLHLIKLAATIAKKKADRHDTVGFMPTTVADQAAIRITAVSRNLTLHNTHHPLQTTNQDSTDRQKHPMQNQSENQPCAIETGKAAGTTSAAKTGHS